MVRRGIRPDFGIDVVGSREEEEEDGGNLEELIGMHFIDIVDIAMVRVYMCECERVCVCERETEREGDISLFFFFFLLPSFSS